jgi:phage terminase small subunit
MPKFDAQMLDVLTPKQRRFIEYRMQGFLPSQAAKKAGMDEGYGREFENDPRVKEILAAYYQDETEEHSVTRDKVVAGMLEGIEICKLQADGVGVVNGWEKLARICGVAAPERKELSISVEGQLIQHELHQLDEQQLLALVGRERQLTLDAEFEEVEDA